MPVRPIAFRPFTPLSTARFSRSNTPLTDAARKAFYRKHGYYPPERQKEDMWQYFLPGGVEGRLVLAVVIGLALIVGGCLAGKLVSVVSQNTDILGGKTPAHQSR